MKDKHGWIRIVEAFLAVLLIAAVLVIIINQQGIKANDTSFVVYNYEIYMLKSIELNDTLRSDLFSASNLPANWTDETFPAKVKDKIENLTPSSLLCEARICLTTDTCNFIGEIKNSIYTQRVFIASTYQIYNPRQLKLFCWAK